MKRRKQNTPLLSALTVSMLCSSLAAMAGAHSIYQKYDTNGWSQPAIAVLMQGLACRDYPWMPSGSSAGSATAAIPAAGQSNTDGLPVVFLAPSDLTGTENESSASGQANTAAPGGNSDGQTKPAAPGNGSNGQTESTATDGDSNNQTEPTAPGGDSNGQTKPTAPGNDSNNPPGSSSSSPSSDGQSESAKTNSSTPDAEVKQYQFTTVTQEYFDDALLIGDSRAEGVALYSGWDNLTYYAAGGMTIYNMFQSKAAEAEGQKLTIEEALQKRSFGKIYLEIGINEMGTGTVDSFMEAYEAAVTRLQELQPDAILYLCGIMYVKQSKSESDPIFNNPNIQARNDRIAGLADGKNIFYLDINELVTDDTGNLNPDYTWDEVHLLGKYDSLWLDYFCSHGIVKEELGN